jgi:hypothetical protein
MKKLQVESNLFFWGSHCDFPKQDLPDRPTTDNIQECGRRCSDDSQCDHFAWSNWNNRCYLKKGQWTDNKADVLLNVQCGFIPARTLKNSENNFIWGYHCDFAGQDLPDRPKAKNIQECGKKCFADPQCDHFAWFTSGEMCYLKKGQWPGNNPTPLAGVRCGYIPGRVNQGTGK